MKLTCTSEALPWERRQFLCQVQGTSDALYGLSRPDGGHAQIDLRNKKGKLVFSGLVDMYCKYPIASLKYITPVLKTDDYTLTVTVKEEHGNWSDKRKKFSA